jgi:predicted RecA/RadA family phage recombinase
MKNFIQPGTRMELTSTGIIAGDLVTVNSKQVGVAAINAATNNTAQIAVEGVFEVPKAAVTVVQGDLLFASGTSLTNVDNTAGSLPCAGYAFEGAASGDANVKVKLARVR